MSMEMWGFPAKIVVEIEMPRATVRVPIADLSACPAPWGQELRIPLRGEWLREVHDAISQVQFRMGTT